MPTRRMPRLAALFLSCTLLAALTACQTVRKAEYNATYLTFSDASETQLGTEYSKELEKEMTFITDPAVQSWVDSMGAQLVQNSPTTAQKFQFKVTTSPVVNAFAIPGGFCYINGGLIVEAESEDEVAAVVGHEINHVTTRHGVRSLQRQTGLDMITQALVQDATASQAVQLVKNAGGVVAMRSFGREDEREADKLGVEAMAKSGYNPQSAVTFFEKLNKLEGGQTKAAGNGLLSFFTQVVSTHPTTIERIENIKTQISTYPAATGKGKTAQFLKVQEIVKAQLKPDAPATDTNTTETTPAPPTSGLRQPAQPIQVQRLPRRVVAPR